MKYYYLEENLHSSSDQNVEPNPCGFLRILESEDIDIEKHIFEFIKFDKTIFFMAYEREGKEFNLYFKNNRNLFCKSTEQLTFCGFTSLFKTENFYRVFFDKTLAIDTARNVMNNIIRQFSVTIALKREEINKEEIRYNKFAEMLSSAQRRLNKETR